MEIAKAPSRRAPPGQPCSIALNQSPNMLEKKQAGSFRLHPVVVLAAPLRLRPPDLKTKYLPVGLSARLHCTYSTTYMPFEAAVIQLIGANDRRRNQNVAPFRPLQNTPRAVQRSSRESRLPDCSLSLQHTQGLVPTFTSAARRRPRAKTDPRVSTIVNFSRVSSVNDPFDRLPEWACLVPIRAALALPDYLVVVQIVCLARFPHRAAHNLSA